MIKLIDIEKPPTDTIYIIGTGPSLRLYPLKFFNDKYTIGLNQAYKLLENTYNLTIHPYLIPVDSTKWTRGSLWITKEKPHDPKYGEHKAAGNYKQFVLFNNRDTFSTFSQGAAQNELYVGRGIQTGAIHLACMLGAKYIILVGCDFSSINGEHHCIDQHTELHGFRSNVVYDEYYYYTDKCRRLAKEYWDAEVFSMSPTLGYQPQDYHRLHQLKELKYLQQPKDVEYVPRNDIPITNFIP